MSKTVLLSIRPQFVEKIVSGEKRFEFRRRVFDVAAVARVMVYSTMPVGMITCQFEVKRILTGSPESVWRKTRDAAGISRSYFREYFDGREQAHAIEIGNLTVFNTPVDPRLAFSRFTAPQSYYYWF